MDSTRHSDQSSLVDAAWARAALLNAGGKWTEEDQPLLDKINHVSTAHISGDKALELSTKLEFIKAIFEQAKESSPIWRAVKHFFSLYFTPKTGMAWELCTLGSNKHLAEVMYALEHEKDSDRKGLLKERLDYLKLSSNEQVYKIAALKLDIREAIDEWYNKGESKIKEKIINLTMKLKFIQGREIGTEEIKRHLDGKSTKQWLFKKLKVTENSEEVKARKIYQLKKDVALLNGLYLEKKDKSIEDDIQTKLNEIEYLEFQRMSVKQQNLVRENLCEMFGSCLYQISSLREELQTKFKNEFNYNIALNDEEFKKLNEELLDLQQDLRDLKDKKNINRKEKERLNVLKENIRNISIKITNDKLNKALKNLKEFEGKLRRFGCKLSNQEKDQLHRISEEFFVKLEREAGMHGDLEKELASIVQLLPAIAMSKYANINEKEVFLGKSQGKYYEVRGVSFDPQPLQASALEDAKKVIETAYELHKIDRDKYIEFMTYVDIISEGKRSPEGRLAQLKTELSNIQQKLKKIEGRKNFLNSGILELDSGKYDEEIQSLNKRLRDSRFNKQEYQKKIIVLESEPKNTKTNEIRILRETIQSGNDYEKKILEEIEKRKTEMNEAKPKEIQELEEEEQQYLNEKEKIQKNIVDLERDLAKARIKETVEKLVEHEKQLDEVQKQLMDIDQQILINRTRLQIPGNESIAREIDILENNRKKIQQEKDQLQRGIIRLEVEQDALLNNVSSDDLKKEFVSVDERINSLKRQIDILASKNPNEPLIVQHKNTVDTLRKEKSIYQELIGRKKKTTIPSKPLKFKNKLRSRHRI